MSAHSQDTTPRRSPDPFGRVLGRPSPSEMSSGREMVPQLPWPSNCVPADELYEFNANLVGAIEVIAEFRPLRGDDRYPGTSERPQERLQRIAPGASEICFLANALKS